MLTLALLANPDSGAGESERVAELLAADGAEVRTFAISDWRDAASAGADRIVVAGGDGSLGCAAEAASEAGVPLAVVPTGTANDFARRRDLPSELEEACALAARGGHRIPLELAHAGTRPFLNVASAGLSPAAAEEAEDLKGRMGALAYPAGAVKAGATAQPIAVTVLCDGELLYEGAAWQVSIASSGAFGGGVELAADQMDGRLDVVVIEGSGRARLVRYAVGMTTRSLEDQEGVRTSRCERVELRLADGEETLNVDGEIVPAAELAEDGAVAFTVEAAAFELVVA
jgi:diacylglycerol kinase family enzyme